MTLLLRIEESDARKLETLLPHDSALLEQIRRLREEQLKREREKDFIEQNFDSLDPKRVYLVEVVPTVGKPYRWLITRTKKTGKTAVISGINLGYKPDGPARLFAYHMKSIHVIESWSKTYFRQLNSLGVKK